MTAHKELDHLGINTKHRIGSVRFGGHLERDFWSVAREAIQSRGNRDYVQIWINVTPPLTTALGLNCPTITNHSSHYPGTLSPLGKLDC